MRVRRNRIDENLPQPMLSPMIDMIFLLLVFFIVSTMYMVEIKTIPIKMPTAAHTQTVTKSTFVVTVKEDGAIYLDDDKIDLPTLCENAKGQLALDENFAVIIRGDKGVEYGAIIKLMDALKGAGITKFGLATETGKNK